MAKKRDIYLMSNGQPVTEGSVSELCGVLDKPFLVPWAAKMTVQAVAEFWKPGQSYEASYIEASLLHAKGAHRIRRDTAGDIGTRVHQIVGAYVEGQLTIDGVADPNEKKALDNFITVTEDWEWLGSEITVINEWCECKCEGVWWRGGVKPGEDKCPDCHETLKMYGYGGTADAIARIGGVVHLIDFKTSNYISPTYSMQCALYADATPNNPDPGFRGAWREIDEARILHFDKSLLTWESLERNIKEHMPFIKHFIGCRRWKKRFDTPNYSNKGDSINVPSSVQ